MTVAYFVVEIAAVDYGFRYEEDIPALALRAF